jgi:hypothetical protein
VLLGSVERVSITARGKSLRPRMAQPLRPLGLRNGSRWSRVTVIFRNVVQRCDWAASPSVEPIRGLGPPIVAHLDCRDSTH